MGLIDNGPHTVLVIPRVQTGTDRANNPVYGDGEPVTVTGLSVQPMSAGEADASEATTMRRIIGRAVLDWPGGIASRVLWDGRAWDQIGEAEKHLTGRRSRHGSVLIRARRTEVR